MAGRKEKIKEQARRLGFELVGIAAAGPAQTFEYLQSWLQKGYAGEMGYMEHHGQARRHPGSILPSVRSVVMVGMNYKPNVGSPEEAKPAGEKRACGVTNTGKIALYARGTDYHDVLRIKLKELLSWIQKEVPGANGRAVVDTAPLLERDFARRAGLGWFGKNTMLLNKKLGSYFFLGALLLDIDLDPDPAHETSHCGSCTACLDACPTQAFMGPGLLDSRRCISYLTIELRGPIAAELREPMGNWIFGCDVCQDVCPWNRKAPPGKEPALQPRSDLDEPNLEELLGLTESEFRQRFRGTALMRAKRGGLLRNAAIALGNQGDVRNLPALEKALHDPDPLVREAAAWAIERITLAPPWAGAG